jgi:hypothetical protein
MAISDMRTLGQSGYASAQRMRDANPGMSMEVAMNRVLNAASTGQSYNSNARVTPQGRPVTTTPGGGGGTGSGGSGSGSGSSGTPSPAEQWLNDIISGKNLPFNAQVQAQQLTQQSDMNAAGEAARNDQLMAGAAAGGASANDPSLQGAKAANFARRQTDNQTSAREIAQTGALANFNAQSGAAGTVAGNAMQREGWDRQAQMQREGWAQEAALTREGWNRQPQGGGGGSFRQPEASSSFLQWGRPAPQQAYDPENDLYQASKGTGVAYRTPEQRAQDAAAAAAKPAAAPSNPNWGPTGQQQGGGYYGGLGGGSAASQPPTTTNANKYNPTPPPFLTPPKKPSTGGASGGIWAGGGAPKAPKTPYQVN